MACAGLPEARHCKHGEPGEAQAPSIVTMLMADEPGARMRTQQGVSRL